MTDQPIGLEAIKRAHARSEKMHTVIGPPGVNSPHDHRGQLIAEVERLHGIKPELPPRPPAGEGLPRYGLRWNGPKEPLAVPMDGGYWTPWHLAERLRARVAELERALQQIKNSCVDDDDEANALFRLSPAELRKLAANVLMTENASGAAKPPHADIDYALRVYKHDGFGIYVDSGNTVPGLHLQAETAERALALAPTLIARLRKDNTAMSEATKPPPAPSADLRNYGYAPGNYTSTCLTCNEQLRDVDKRCRTCRTCAEKRRDEAMSEGER